MKEIIKRLLVMAAILIVTCEVGLRLRLAYLYRDPGWLLYHQFKFRTAEEIAKEDLPSYYRDRMFAPFKLVYKPEALSPGKDIITVESSALRSARRQLQKMLDQNAGYRWVEYSPTDDKQIVFSDNNIVLYEFLVYPDIYNTIKREARVMKRFLGATLDDFLYHNLAFYMHIDENVNFTVMDSDKTVKDYLGLLRQREEPLCKDIYEGGYENVVYVITPNIFDPGSPGGRIYLKYVKAAYAEMMGLLKKYRVRYIDMMNEKVAKEDFTDYFHLSPEGGRKISRKIIVNLDKMRF